MKKYLTFIFLLFFFGSAFSNSKELKFNWKLEDKSNLLQNGMITSSTETDRSDILTGCNNHSSELDCFTRSCICFRGSDFVTYEVVSSTNIIFYRNNVDFNMPEHFSILLENGAHNLNHTFNTHYILRGQTATIARNLSGLLCLFCCCPFYISYMLCASNSNSFSRVGSLERALPNDLPEHVTLSQRSLSHRISSDWRHINTSRNTVLLDSNTYIFDIFLNTPETQKWILNHLSPNGTDLSSKPPKTKGCSWELSGFFLEKIPIFSI